MKSNSVFAVVLAGGKSSRLFPFNKVLSDLTGSGKSLIQQAVGRLGVKDSYVLTVKEMVGPIRKQLKLPLNRFYVDPVRRGTWPAILWAIAHLRRQNPDAVMAILTADHVIQGDSAFRKAFRQALELAQNKPAIVTMGITPRNNPDEWRGFGCFRASKDGQVTEFQEKPTVERAAQMISENGLARRSLGEGGWLWNSGMFFFRIATAEKALERLQPEMYSTYTAIVSALAAGKKKEAASLYQEFPEKIQHPLDAGRLVDNSIDYAVMAPLVKQNHPELSAYAVRDVRFHWTDLGQWTALRQVMKPDRHGNLCIGDVKVGQGVRDSILVADRGHRIEVSGINHMVLAFSGGKALVLPESDIARIKDIVAAQTPNALIGEPRYVASFARSKRGRVAILSNRSKEAI